MKLVIAEKPSVALSIAKVLGAKKRGDGYVEGNDYIVSWCVGHLVQMAQPDTYDSRFKSWKLEDLPIIPNEYRYEVAKNTRKQFTVLKKLLNDKRVDTVVNACDSGREGELIFRLVYNQANCKKKMQRLWINSMEDSAIRQGFNHLKDGRDYDSLFDSASARAIADWLVGMNLSRLYSCLYKETFSVGRVQTPTLYMIAERDWAIETFKKERYFTVDINLGDFELVSERIDDEGKAQAIKAGFPSSIAIETVEQKEKITRPEKPYDLTSLQREANKFFGFSAKQTLDYLQNLYEKKWVTYPRTDSRYVTDDMVDTVKSLLRKADSHFRLNEDNFKSIFDSSKVTDHYAIIPTELSAGKTLDGLPDEEQKIYTLVLHKLLAACSENLIESNTKVSFHHEGILFSASGKAVLQEGFAHYFKDYGRKKKEQVLPVIDEGQRLEVVDKKVSEKFTKPPQHYTEETLLKAMELAGTDELDKNISVERKGLGTPATRAGVIENLIYRKFIERDKKNLVLTEKGNRLVTIVEESFRSAKTTADWEMKLSLIAQNKLCKEDFLHDIEKTIDELIKRYQH